MINESKTVNTYCRVVWLEFVSWASIVLLPPTPTGCVDVQDEADAYAPPSPHQNLADA